MTHVRLLEGDCMDHLREMPEASVDSVVTDPPYGLSFMGKAWDKAVPGTQVWAECLRVLKPGGHLLAFAGTRTQHRMAVAIEDAGFEIRDMIAWLYGSGFPKSLDVSKAIDKTDASADRLARRYKFTEWFVLNCELSRKEINRICETKDMARHWTDIQPKGKQPDIPIRKHFELLRPHINTSIPEWVEKLVDDRTVESRNFSSRKEIGSKMMRNTSEIRIAIAQDAGGYDGSNRREVKITSAFTSDARRWQGWGTALKPALEPITVARKPLHGTVAANVTEFETGAINIDGCRVGDVDGRWPANLIHDGSAEVVELFPESKGQTGADRPGAKGDTGSAARFFYCAKATKTDRNDGLTGLEARPSAASEFRPNHAEKAALGEGGNPYGRWKPEQNPHPTVKPTALMQYLCRLVTPPGGTVLDPFLGSGSTGRGAVLERFNFIGIEMNADEKADFIEIARLRIAAAGAEKIEVTRQPVEGVFG